MSGCAESFSRFVRTFLGVGCMQTVSAMLAGCLLAGAACSTAPSAPQSSIPRDKNTAQPAGASQRPASSGPPPTVARAAGEAYFEMETILGDRFVFKLTDEAKIRQAREIVDKQLPKRVAGKVVVTPQPYNKPWHFHLAPASVEFSYLTDAQCDAAIHYLEDHLREIGISILPSFKWCPLSSRLVRELPPPSNH